MKIIMLIAINEFWLKCIITELNVILNIWLKYMTNPDITLQNNSTCYKRLCRNKKMHHVIRLIIQAE